MPHFRTHTSVSQINPIRFIKNLSSTHKTVFTANRLRGWLLWPDHFDRQRVSPVLIALLARCGRIACIAANRLVYGGNKGIDNSGNKYGCGFPWLAPFIVCEAYFNMPSEMFRPHIGGWKRSFFLMRLFETWFVFIINILMEMLTRFFKKTCLILRII